MFKEYPQCTNANFRQGINHFRNEIPATMQTSTGRENCQKISKPVDNLTKATTLHFLKSIKFLFPLQRMLQNPYILTNNENYRFAKRHTLPKQTLWYNPKYHSVPLPSTKIMSYQIQLSNAPIKSARTRPCKQKRQQSSRNLNISTSNRDNNKCIS